MRVLIVCLAVCRIGLMETLLPKSETRNSPWPEDKAWNVDCERISGNTEVSFLGVNRSSELRPAQSVADFSRYFRSNTITIGLSWPGMCFVIVKVFRSAESPI